MKISCQSCHSKYNVADDKVQGKIVKIRCRKCGSTIVVNATAGMASNGSAPAPLPTAPSTASMAGDSFGLGPAIPTKAGVAGEWHVSVTDTDQRTMSLEELVTAYNAGEVTQDAFIWTEGMEDWKPLGEVDTVVSALYAFAGQAASPEAGGHAAPAPVAASPAYEAASPSPRMEHAPAAYGTGIAAHAVAVGADIRAAGGDPAPEPRRAAVVKREARARDLFATRSGEELQGSAPMPPGSSPPGTDDSRLTGQRNENSVLFSLDHLTRNAAAPTARFEPTPGPSKDDSGLIDLKALALKAESMRPPTTAQSNLLAPPLGFAPPLGAPMGFGAGPEAQPKSKLPLLIGAGAGIALLMVLCIVIGLKIGGAATPAVSAAASASASATPSAATAEPNPSASASAAAQASASASDAAPLAAAPKAHPAGGVAWKPNPGVGAGGGAKPAPTGAAQPAGGAATPAPASKKGDCGCNGDLLCMMKCSTH
jgi:predicted Zn finger-like uncharacterized protein